jgi:hypothetical protein
VRLAPWYRTEPWATVAADRSGLDSARPMNRIVRCLRNGSRCSGANGLSRRPTSPG